MELKPIMHSHFPRVGDEAGQQQLRAAWRRFDEYQDRQELRMTQDKVAEEVICEQDSIGLEIVTDGLVRWHDTVSHPMAGFVGVKIGRLFRYMDTNTYFRQPQITEKMAWALPRLREEWRFLLQTTDTPVKLVLTGPYTLAMLSDRTDFGKPIEVLVEELARAVGRELKALPPEQLLHQVGMIQIEEPMILQRPQDMAMVSLALSTIRRMIGEKHHLNLTTYFGDASPVIEQLQRMPVDSLGLDFTYSQNLDESLLHYGCDKELVFGMIDGRNTRIESPAELVSRLQRLSNRLQHKRGYLSTSCGLEYLPRATALEKLRLTKQVAEQFNHVQAQPEPPVMEA